MGIFESLDWLWLCIGFSGAVAVIVGVWGEEWTDGRNIPTKRKERRKFWFWIILLAGLSLDLIGFFGEASTSHALKAKVAGMEHTNLLLRSNIAALEWKVMEASNNIVKNDVRNWPISEMNAVAWFTVMGTNMNELTNLPSGRKAQMTLWKNEREGFSLDNLEAANGDISEYFPIFVFGTRDRHIYRVALHSFNFMTAEGIKPPLVKIIDDVQLVHVDLNFLPHDSQISSGRIILTVNNVTKYFDVPNQNDTIGLSTWLLHTLWLGFRPSVDDLVVGDRFHLHCLFQEPKEEFAA